MVKKLRLKIVLSTLISVLIVLVGVVFLLNLTNYSTLIKDTDYMLNIIISNNGKMPEVTLNFEDEELRFASKEVMYETRYFSLLYDENGEKADYNITNIMSVNDANMDILGKEALESNNTIGFVDDFRYKKTTLLNNQTLIVFVDCGKSLNVFRSTLETSIIYSAIGYLVVILLSIFLAIESTKAYTLTERKQREFISNAGHEIKTPIAIIDADTEVMEIDYGNNRWCEDIHIQTKRLTNLTSNLITLAKMEDVNKKIVCDCINVSPALLETAKSFASVAKTQNKKYEYFVEENMQLKISEKELQEMLSILIDNAIKYSTEEGNINLKISRKDKWLNIKISNDVPENVTPEIIKHMFDRFYRGDTSHSSKIAGSGIGLSVAKAVCERYSGNIKANINNGQIIITATLRG